VGYEGENLNVFDLINCSMTFCDFSILSLSTIFLLDFGNVQRSVIFFFILFHLEWIIHLLLSIYLLTTSRMKIIGIYHVFQEYVNYIVVFRCIVKKQNGEQ